MYTSGEIIGGFCLIAMAGLVAYAFYEVVDFFFIKKDKIFALLWLLYVLITVPIAVYMYKDMKNEKENMMIIEGDTIYCEDCGRDMIIATIREEAGSKVIHYHCRKCGSEVGDKVATVEEMDRLKSWVLD